MTARKGKNNKIRIYWDDAVIYKRNYGEQFPKPTKMLTYGRLVRETRDYMMVANPLTEQYSSELKEFVPKPNVMGKELKEATFFYIPKGMITKITPL